LHSIVVRVTRDRERASEERTLILVFEFHFAIEYYHLMLDLMWDLMLDTRLGIGLAIDIVIGSGFDIIFDIRFSIAILL
jgi:hypothetical protein